MVEEHQNSINTPYKFNGKEQDDETGNYYYGARYYNPKFSFWLSVDPLAEKFSSWSPYNYTMNNPINMIDPDGRAPDTVPVTGDASSQTKLIEQINNVTGGSYEIIDGLLVATDGNYGEGTNADSFRTAIESENDIPILAVTNDDDVYFDSYYTTAVDVGDLAFGDKAFQGEVYAHFMEERIAAGSRFSSLESR